MNVRKKGYGEANMVGRNIEQLRKLRKIKQKDFVEQMQVMGCDINRTSFSKLEGQVRLATDKEVCAAAQILEVSTDSLFE